LYRGEVVVVKDIVQCPCLPSHPWHNLAWSMCPFTSCSTLGMGTNPPGKKPTQTFRQLLFLRFLRLQVIKLVLKYDTVTDSLVINNNNENFYSPTNDYTTTPKKHKLVIIINQSGS